MFFSITHLYSVKLKNPYTRKYERWVSLENEQDVLIYLARHSNWPYKVVTVYNGQILTITHKYCERMLWGFEGYGIGLDRPRCL